MHLLEELDWDVNDMNWISFEKSSALFILPPLVGGTGS